MASLVKPSRHQCAERILGEKVEVCEKEHHLNTAF